MLIFFYIITACFLISGAALIGVLGLLIKKQLLNKIVLFLVSLAAGAFMGSAFLDLLPKAAETAPVRSVLLAALISFALFFLIEKLFRWRHCHKGQCHIHTFGYINLLGDGAHNFIDGLIIAAAFLTDVKLGITVTTAVAMHEIPQEIGDFAVLIYAGLKRTKALLINFAAATTVIAGGIVGYFMSLQITGLMPYLLSFAAGSFIYIATSDLIPELKKETEPKKSMALFLYFLLGILIIYLL